MQSFILDSLLIVLILSCVPMAILAFVSGAIALVQAATQIQEQSVLHLAKILTFSLIVVVAGNWASGEIVALFERAVQSLDSVGKVAR